MKIKQLATAVSLIALSATLATFSGNAFAASHGGAMAMEKGAPVKASEGVLVGTNGMTLYTFDKDAAGKSMCNGACATNWPPLMATAADSASGDYSIITRDDGSQQWAMKGKPLYYWVKDAKPGDKTGDGFNNVWHVAKP